MKDTYQIYKKLIDNNSLSHDEAYALADGILSDSFSSVQVAAILTALKMKGETAAEIHGFVLAMRKHMIPVAAHELAVDTCGTGGDGAETFNISTTVAFVVAAAGVPVIKHGNRSASGACGSSDCLEALKININLPSTQASQLLKHIGMVFLFAPLYHPALKALGPIRKELGFRTIFNLLGPFCNPAGVRRQCIGVPNREIAEKLILVARELGYHHLVIVCNEEGMDELGLSGVNHVFELKDGAVQESQVTAQDFNLHTAPIGTLKGGTTPENAAIVKAILEGETGPKRDVVLLNAGYALYISGTVATVPEGIAKARAAIDSGKAAALLENLRSATHNYA